MKIEIKIPTQEEQYRSTVVSLSFVMAVTLFPLIVGIVTNTLASTIVGGVMFCCALSLLILCIHKRPKKGKISSPENTEPPPI